MNRLQRSTLKLLLVVLFSFSSALASESIVRRPADLIDGEYIVVLRDSVTATEVDDVAAKLAKAHHGAIVETWHSALHGFWVQMPSADAAALARDPRVARVEQNVRMHASASEVTGFKSGAIKLGTFADRYQPHPIWQLTRISHRFRVLENGSYVLPTRPDGNTFEYPYCSSGKNVVAYMLDTGVLRLHDEFVPEGATPSLTRRDPADAPNILELGDSNEVQSLQHPDVLPSSMPNPNCNPPLTSPLLGKYHWFDAEPWFTDPLGQEISHGTACASALGGRVVGVAKDVTIIPVKVIGCTFDFSSAYIISGLNWVKSNEEREAARNNNHRRPALISMSTFRFVKIVAFAGTVNQESIGTDLNALETAAKNVMDYGIPMIVSANNLGTDACATTPARLSRRGGLGRAITVGGLSKASDTRWENPTPANPQIDSPGSSNFGTCVDIFAPAEDTVVADTPSWYAYRTGNASGTSFSAPIVAGIVARLMSEDQTLTAALDTNPITVVDTVWNRLRDTATRAPEPNPNPSVQPALGYFSPRLLAYVGPVLMTTQPVDQAIEPGATTTLNVGTSDPTASYQWYTHTTDHEPVALSGNGANSSTLTVTAGAAGTETEYFARVTSHCPNDVTPMSADSAVAVVRSGTVVVTESPASWWSRTNVAIPPLKVKWQAASGVTPVVVWYWSSYAAPTVVHQLQGGATSGSENTLTVTQPDTGSEAEPVFWAEVTAAGRTIRSDFAQYHYCNTPSLTIPSGTSVHAGDSFPLDVTSSAGSSPAIYRWSKDSGFGLEPVPLPNLVYSNTKFHFEAVSPCCPDFHDSRDVAVTVSECFAIANTFAHPTIISPAVAPAGYYTLVDPDQQVTLEMVEVTHPPGTVTWQRRDPGGQFPTDGQSNVTNSDTQHSYDTRISTKPGQSGVYRGIMKYPAGSSCGAAERNSLDIGVMVRPTVSVSQSPPNWTNHTITLTAIVGLPYLGTSATYQWHQIVATNDQAISGATSNTYAVSGDGAYFVEVTVPQTLNLDVGARSETTRTTSALLDVRFPTCTYTSMDLWDPMTSVYSNSPVAATVPAGRSVVLSAHVNTVNGQRPTRSDYYTWTFESGRTEQEFRTRYTAADTGAHEVKVRFESEPNCNSGTSDDHKYVVTTAPATCDLVESFPPSPTAAISKNATLTFAVTLQAGVANATYEWRKSNLSDENPSSNAQALPPFSTERTVTVGPGLYWVRVRGVCPSDGTTPVVEDSPLIAVFCSDCGKPRPVRGHVAVNNQGSQSSTVWTFSTNAVVALTPPALVTGGTYKWYSSTPYDDSVGPLSSGPSYTVPTAAAGSTTYWVLTTDGADNESVSYPVTINVIQGTPSSVMVTVDPAQVVPYDTLLTMKVNANALAVAWYRGDYNSTEVVSREELLAIVALEDETYWVQVGSQRSDLVHIVTTCTGYQPLVSIIPRPLGGHLARYQSAWLTAFGLGKSLYYEWFEGSVDGLRAGWGPAIVPYPTHDTTYVVRATDACGNQATASTTVRVCIPTIDSQPLPSIEIGPSVTYPLEIHATPAQTGQGLTYQWYRGVPGGGHTAIAGATNARYDVTSADTGWYYCEVLGPCDDYPDGVVSRPTWVSACTPPQIIATTAHNEALPGDLVTLVVNVSGTHMTFFWYRGETGDLTNPVNNADMFLNLHPTQDEKYWVRVYSDGICYTDTAPMVVLIKPQIVGAPVAANAQVMSGATTTVSVEANGTGLTYQWYRGSGTSDPVGAGAAIATPAITVDTQFWVRVTSSNGTYSDSDPVWVRLCSATAAWVSPAPQLHFSEPYMLSITATPGVADGAQVSWYRGTSGDIAHSTLLASATSSTTYAVAPQSTTDYWARVQSGACWVDTPTLTARVCLPTITTQPAATLQITSGTTEQATLNIAANGEPTSFQWYAGARGVTTTPAGTGQSLQVRPTATTTYWCRVTSSCAATTDSNAAVVTVCDPAHITSVFGDSIVRGGTATVGVNATGTDLIYRWYWGHKGDTTSLASTSRTFSSAMLNTATLWVRVTAGCGVSGDSDDVTVHVCTTPSIDTQPLNQSVFSGRTATLVVAASEQTSEPLHYQWLNASGAPVGSDSPTYVTPALTQPTTYSVRVTAGICGVDSNVASISICGLPEVVAAPPDQNAYSGQSIRLTVAASGSSYIFYRGTSGDRSVPISSQQVANYIDVTPAATTSYWADVINGSCVSRTGTATVNVCVPRITQQPTGTQITAGGTAPLSVGIDRTDATFQWYKGSVGTITNPVTPNGNTQTINVSPTTQTTYWVRITSVCGPTVDSGPATITICQPPIINSITAGTWIARGQSIPLAVNASGTPVTGNNSLGYQWYVGTAPDTSNPVFGGSTASISVSPQNTTTYWVRVTGQCGTVNSTPVQISVCAPPTINTQPASSTIFSGTSTTISVGASDVTTTPLSYQWYRGSAPDTSTPVGTNSPSFTTPALTAQTNYWVRVSNGPCDAVNSETAAISICPLAQTLAGPADVYISPGDTTRLQIGPFSGASAYLWYMGAASDTSHTLQATYYVDVAPQSNTQYWVRVWDGGCVSDSTTTTVYPCVPAFTAQPTGTTINAGTSTTLTATASTPNVAYRWYVGTAPDTSTPAPNGQTSSLVVAPSQPTNYWVRATSTCGRTRDSNTVTVSICTPPAITTQPQAPPPLPRNTAWSISVSATGNGTPQYRWYYGQHSDTSQPVPGGTNATLQIVTYGTQYYWVRVTGNCTYTDSNDVLVSVYPVITNDPQSADVPYGGSTQLSVGATGNMLHYQWYQGEPYDISHPVGTDSPTFTTPALFQNVSYYCLVKSGQAGTYSQPAYINLY